MVYLYGSQRLDCNLLFIIISKANNIIHSFIVNCQNASEQQNKVG